MKRGKSVAVSGGFDPVHRGHISLIQEARKLGDRLIVILNNDNWLMKKKGYVFMPEDERAMIMRAIKGVDEVVLTSHPKDTADMSICKELEEIRPSIYANGGDRHADNIPEYKLCEELGTEMAFNVGEQKQQSSSELIDRARAAK